MNTIKQASENTGINTRLINSVIRQLGGRDSLEDIYNHGIGGGFSGFIYYVDTVAFFKRNRKQIIELVEEMADQLGDNPIDMVANFNCLNDDHDTRKSIAKCLYGSRLNDDDTQVANALAWFAGEEVARAMCDTY